MANYSQYILCLSKEGEARLQIELTEPAEDYTPVERQEIQDLFRSPTYCEEIDGSVLRLWVPIDFEAKGAMFRFCHFFISRYLDDALGVLIPPRGSACCSESIGCYTDHPFTISTEREYWFKLNDQQGRELKSLDVVLTGGFYKPQWSIMTQVRADETPFGLRLSEVYTYIVLGRHADRLEDWSFLSVFQSVNSMMDLKNDTMRGTRFLAEMFRKAHPVYAGALLTCSIEGNQAKVFLYEGRSSKHIGTIYQYDPV